MIFFLLLTSALLTACVTTKAVVETKIEYVKPEIPAALLDPCEQIPGLSAQTNGELLMAYLSLQTSYIVCSSKVSSISMILQSYENIYNSDNKSEDASNEDKTE